MHILLLTDRDWHHPQGGGTGTNLHGQVVRWLEWGHQVTIVAGDFPGAAREEHPQPGLAIHRMGSRLTVFGRAAWASFRGLGRDADIVIEVVNGIAFFTPLWRWLDVPVVALVHHVHQDHYVTELGWKGRVAALVLERLPLTLMYRARPMMTISHSAADDMVALGVPRDNIHVAYLGTEPSDVPVVEQNEQPTLLYLGRLKAYKRVESVLDVLEGLPEAHLDIAGDGDHRPALEAEVDRRGMHDRVTFHGFVSEEEKSQLYDRCWLSLTASSAEGWCLTVMEAADRGRPSAALRVGGLPESIADQETGLLFDDVEELAVGVRDLMRDDERREAFGRAAKERAAHFTWDATARSNLELLEETQARGRVPARVLVRKSDTARTIGLAGATMANNVIQLIFTIVVTRLLGADGYGALAAVVSAFLILLVGGQSIQAAAARESALGKLGDAPRLRATLERWSRTLALATVVMTVVGVLLRGPLAALIGVSEHEWAAAFILPTGTLWMLLSLQRGALQGLHAYKAVGSSLVVEALGRLVVGVGLVLVGAGVVGAFVATPICFVLTAIWLGNKLARRLGPPAPDGEAAHTLRSLAATGWAPIAGLLLLAVLQNIDVIIARHQLSASAAGAYAVAAVAAKVVVWVAIGVGLQLLPSATARGAAGLDPRPVLARSLAVLALVAAPALVIFVAIPGLVLRIAFGAETEQASGALPVLTVAMIFLACAYLTVQYMLALGSTSFLWVLGVVAVVEVALLFGLSETITGFAVLVLGAQLIVACVCVFMGLRMHRPAGPALEA